MDLKDMSLRERTLALRKKSRQDRASRNVRKKKDRRNMALATSAYLLIFAITIICAGKIIMPKIAGAIDLRPVNTRTPSTELYFTTNGPRTSGFN